MRRRWFMLLTFLGLLWLAWEGWMLVKGDPLLSLLFFIFAGAAAGFFVVKTVLPWMADAVGTSVFLSGERLRPGDNPPELEDDDLSQEEKSDTDEPENGSPS